MSQVDDAESNAQCRCAIFGNAMKDWDDIRYFLAIAETGSLAAAARRPRVRRIPITPGTRPGLTIFMLG